MARPPHLRRIDRNLEASAFKPIGRPMRELATVTLGLDGLEALRLADLEGLYQEAVAERMGVSRTTLARILAHARATVAEALVEGKALLIGDAPVVAVTGEPIPCPVHGGGRRRGRGCRCRRGRRGGVDAVADPNRVGSEEPEGGHNAGV